MRARKSPTEPRFRPLPDREVLADRYAYDPATGHITHRNPLNPSLKGKRVGENGVSRYILCAGYPAHRVIWKLAHGVDPVGDIDHINGDGRDNRIANLRDVSRSTNIRNQNSKRSNTKFQGVSWVSSNQRFQAYINSTYIGQYKTLIDAVAARLRAERFA